MNKIRKKVLIIPSWYPTANNPVRGSFVREQAQLVQDTFDVRVLVGFNKYVKFKKALINIVAPDNLANKLTRGQDEIVLSPPEVTMFGYGYAPFFSERLNYNLLLNSYEQAYKNLVKENWQPDIIHAHCTDKAGIIAAYLSNKYNVPSIITEHQVFLLHHVSKFYHHYITKALEKANTVIAVSYHQMRSILMHHIKCQPVVIGNFINENLFELRIREEQQSFKILTVTYPNYIKDNDTFFKAIGLFVAKGYTNIKVTVIGNNATDIREASTSEFEKLARKYNVLEYCTFISHVDRSEMVGYYHNHHVLVCTSIAETFGLAIAEALATGMPVISTNCGGVDDILTSENGIKVNIRDYEAITEALIQIKCKAIQFNPEALRASVVHKFGTAIFKSRIENIYAQTLLSKTEQKISVIT